MFLVNSRLGLFSATHRSSRSESFHPHGHPFSRSYGVNLPNSLTKVLSITLGLLPQPTSVGLRYGRSHPNNEVFLDSRIQLNRFGLPRGFLLSSAYSKGGFTSPRTYNRRRTMSNGHAQSIFLYSPRFNGNGRCWNINQLSIAYAFRPRLRPD